MPVVVKVHGCCAPHLTKNQKSCCFTCRRLGVSSQSEASVRRKCRDKRLRFSLPPRAPLPQSVLWPALNLTQYKSWPPPSPPLCRNVSSYSSVITFKSVWFFPVFQISLCSSFRLNLSHFDLVCFYFYFSTPFVLPGSPGKTSTSSWRPTTSTRVFSDASRTPSQCTRCDRK